MVKKYAKPGEKVNPMKTAQKPGNKPPPSQPENPISDYLGKLINGIEFIKQRKITDPEALEFLKTLPGKLMKKGKKEKAKKPRPSRAKRERKPKAKKKKSKPTTSKRRTPISRITPKTLSSTEISAKLGHKDTFKPRAGLDPRYSVDDTPLEDIGKGGGSWVKQDCKRYQYSHWEEALKHQSQDWKHIIWLDPSGPAAMILPHHQFHVKDPKIVKGRCPTKVNLAKEFGTRVEFIYLSPPWKDPNMGNGKRGYFTLEHLKKLNFSEVQAKGFVFMWIPFRKMPKIRKIMEAKGYSFVDSCGSLLTNFGGRVKLTKRNPHAKLNSNDREDLIGRTSGMCIKGVLWKKTSGLGKERFRIGNQIMYDCFQWKQKTDQYTGQFQPEHGYAYQLYHYLIVGKPEETDVIHALHLFCRPDMTIKNFGGVQYFPEYDFKKQCLKTEAANEMEV